MINHLLYLDQKKLCTVRDIPLSLGGAARHNIENAMLAGSIGNSKFSNSAITVTDGSSSTATSLGGTITFSGTNNEVEVAESSDEFRIDTETDNQLNFAIKLLNG